MHPPDRIALRKRVLSAGFWSLGGYGCSQLLRFGSNLLLTRLLNPKMFGVMAIATMVMVGLAMFSDLGLKPSVVQSRRGNDAAFLNTAWVTQILRGLLLWLLALIASLLIYYANQVGMVPTGTVYAEPILPFVVAILSITAVTAGFEIDKAARGEPKSLTQARRTDRPFEPNYRNALHVRLGVSRSLDLGTGRWCYLFCRIESYSQPCLVARYP